MAFDLDGPMSNTEIGAALVAYVSGEMTPSEAHRIFLPDNVSRALEFAMVLFSNTAHALQQESPDLMVKTNLHKTASLIVDKIEELENRR